MLKADDGLMSKNSACQFISQHFYHFLALIPTEDVQVMNMHFTLFNILLKQLNTTSQKILVKKEEILYLLGTIFSLKCGAPVNKAELMCMWDWLKLTMVIFHQIIQ